MGSSRTAMNMLIVQHVISILHRALQQSIERDKNRIVNMMNLIVSDK